MNLLEKIVTIQNELRATKDGTNTFAKYNYFQPDTILNLLNPLLQKHKVFIRFNLHYKDTHYQAELIICDVEKPEAIETYVFDILKATVKGANEAQNSGATLTYAKRYSLMNAFNIAENDADFDSDEMKKKELNGKTEQKEEPQENLTEKYELMFKDKTAEEIKELYNKLPTKDKGKDSIAYKIAKFYSDQLKQPTDEVLALISKITLKTTEAQFSVIEGLIESTEQTDKRKLYLESFQAQLNKVGSKYVINCLPF